MGKQWHHRHHSGDHYTSEHRIDRHGNIDTWSERLHNEHSVDYSGKELLNDEDHISDLVISDRKSNERHDHKINNDRYKNDSLKIDDHRRNSNKIHDSDITKHGNKNSEFI